MAVNENLDDYSVHASAGKERLKAMAAWEAVSGAMGLRAVEFTKYFRPGKSSLDLPVDLFLAGTLGS
jgi:hypothetical protein